ncbi:SNARE protein Syntaxin 18/UFE1 [Plasmopara halstedii]|uniref:SNARE protein Syntaxin 18/UFE1 n=1 Tax=Plasmopara halstedii TaxID=4781 RepID=A0A0P1A9F5_PLAHL|nr:SNARE protein Syntaxin 18/UFE1 [Plasmopara halstedii]CEG37237.1 SNARE protein Syntaxin 18/UFE1 [Plasmopara halstedii]|eukprot:XP_024573606.1 SNARE protein Syntaxin 18/UFE1 [Plasmopara halstedii]
MRVDVTASFRKLAPARPQPPRNSDAFTVEAMDLLSSLLELENLLRRVRPQYLLPTLFIRIKESRMSEKDKDELDADWVELIKSCSCRIDELQEVVKSQPVASSVGAYRSEVVAYLFERLKSIADCAKQMQKRRFQQPFLLSSRLLSEDDRQKLDALEKEISESNPERVEFIQDAATLPQTAKSPTHSKPKSPTKLKATESITPHAAPQAEPMKQDISHRSISKIQRPTPNLSQQSLVFTSQNDKLEFSEEEERRFRVENVMLHRHFQENLEDAKKMESKMAEISNLMGQFASKILEQQTDIELIHHHAHETKSNLTQSNRILEQTQNIGRSYGFIIFCFYAGFSTILHLLHYFNN